MRTRKKDIFITIRTEGSILPSDILQRIAAGDRALDGLSPEEYHLGKGEKLNEVINRSWNRLLGVWASFKAGMRKLPPGDPATTITRERWLLVLFQELGYGRLLTSKAVEIDGRSYPISHAWQNTPIHLVGCRIDLDHRTAGVAGAARTSPHSLTQEFLNRSGGYLWAFVSNGHVFRILRDNVRLTRQSYVEFGLQAMMDGEVYADFVLFWLLCHQSRVEAERPDQCWLEKWSKSAHQQGTRVMEQLREGVEHAITAFGCGFLAHPANRKLKEKLKSGELNTHEYYRQLLRLVYRLIFLFVAEDRGLLLDPKAPPSTQELYMRFYSMNRIRSLAGRARGSKHIDLYRGFRIVMEKLGSDGGCPELGLPALGSFLWSKQAIPELADCDISNSTILEAFRALAYTTDGSTRRLVDYKNLGSEELGSVYESLLELHPVLDTNAGTFELKTAVGSERKTTGSYYTPTSLITCLLDSALDPILDKAVKQKDPEIAILNLKVCDPSCGSGHFLIAAAHRIAKRLASVRTGDDEPAPEAQRTALRDVIGRCIYGVDINEMAVELCKVGLWMEALEPGKPLSFLDHRILCGNSLLGATPALLNKGIPDDAFWPNEGDDKKLCAEFKRRNKQERETGLTSLFDYTGSAWPELRELASCMTILDNINDDSFYGIQQKQRQYYQCINSTEYIHSRTQADAWCAAFVWKKTKGYPYPITEGVFRKIEQGPDRIPNWMREEIQRLAGQYQFVHWHLAFPDVFKLPGTDEQPENVLAGWSGGFDLVLGNPPWEKINLKDEEFFFRSHPEISNSPNKSVRKELIKKLKETSPDIYKAYLDEQSFHDRLSAFFRYSGLYPLTGLSRINLYSVFAENALRNISLDGRFGLILASGIVTDDNNKQFFDELISSKRLINVWDFENREGIFPDVHRLYKFCIICASGKQNETEYPDFLFWIKNTEELLDTKRRFTLSYKELNLINPISKTCPTFRTKHEADLANKVYTTVNAWCLHDKEGDWPGIPKTPFNMSNDSGLFSTKQQLFQDHREGGFDKNNYFKIENNYYLSLYESKLIHQFNHRYATFGGIPSEKIAKGQPGEVLVDNLKNPFYSVEGRYWLERNVHEYRYPGNWFLVYRKITGSANERTSLATIIPNRPCGDSLIIIDDLSPLNSMLVSANLNAFIYDYVARQKIAGMNFNHWIWKQLPVADQKHIIKKGIFVDNPINWICNRVLELIYTSWDLCVFSDEYGYTGPPFCWDEQRRFLIRCELDAAYFHLFGIDKDDVEYVMETFPIVKRKDEASYGLYRTKEKILEIYDKMKHAINTGKSYQTELDPPPGPPAVWPLPLDQPWPVHIHPLRK